MTTPAAVGDPASAADTSLPSGRRVALGGFVVLLIAFLPTVASFPSTWTRYATAHGWITAGLALWLIHDQRRAFAVDRSRDPLLLLPVVALSMGWLLAIALRLQVGHQIAFVCVLAAWGLAVFGVRRAGAVGIVAATFVLGLPINSAIVAVLQPITTVASGNLAKVVGLDAVIEGNFIHIPAGTFEVAGGCAGVRTFISGTVVGILYAHLFATRTRTRLAVVALAAGIAIVGNWVRVVLIMAVGQWTAMESSLMTNHAWLGWVVFGAGLIPFFYLAGRMTRRRPGAGGPDLAAAGPEDPGSAGRADLRIVGLATGLAATGPLLFTILQGLPAGETPTAQVAAIVQGEGWAAVDPPGERPFDFRPDYQGATEATSTTLVKGSRRLVFDHFIYRNQGQGAELIGYPNRIAPPDDLLDDRVVGPLEAGGGGWVRQAVVRGDDGVVITWYWYRVGGARAVSTAHAKLLELPAFFRRKRAAELIALTTRCGQEDCAEGVRALADLTGAALPATFDPAVEDAPGAPSTTSRPGASGAVEPLSEDAPAPGG